MRAGGHTERELERILIRLGTAVHEEHTREVELRELHELLGGARADLHVDCVCLEVTGQGLLCDRLGPGGVPVTEPRDRVASIHVEDAFAPAVPEPDAFARDDLDRILGEDLCQVIARGRGVNGGCC